MPQTLSLPFCVASGEEQMAIDARLLAWASEGSARAAFRTYGWSKPTLSLGRAEPFPASWDLASLGRDGIDIVRRPTGGDAVLHDQELTFAVATSLPGPWGTRPREFANLVADALAGALRALDLPATRVEAAAAGADFGSRDAQPLVPGAQPCFARTAPGEVRVGAFKVAGIASRFTRGAALSHASVPLSARHRDVARYRVHSASTLEQDTLARHARSVSEILGRPVESVTLANALQRELARALGRPFTRAEFDAIGIQEPLGAPAAW